MALLMALLWRARLSQNLRYAAMLSATLLAVPLALLYDNLLVLVATGWLLREAREHGFLSWEKLVLLAVYPLALLTFTVGQAFHLPLGPMTTCAVLVLCLRRVWLGRQAATTAPPIDRYAAPLGATP